MGLRDRSRRAQLQALLGELGTVQPYVSRANGTKLTPGWYIELALDDWATAEAALRAATMWMTRDGLLFAGLDTTHAAAQIERLRALTEA